MKKINLVYYIPDDVSYNNGVLEKIISQAYEWKKNGKVGKISFIVHQPAPDSTLDVLGSVYVLKRPGLLLGRTFCRLLGEIKPDLIYSRYYLYRRGLLACLASKSYKLVIEINGSDVHELWRIFIQRRSIKSFVIFVYNYLLRNVLLRKCDGFVSVSNELVDLVGLGSSCVVIPNSIPSLFAKSVKISDILERKSNKHPVFLFMSKSGKPWVGYDKVLQLAQYFKKSQFYVVGLNSERMATESGVSELPDNVKCFGYVSDAKERKKIMLEADVAIGSLALYRYGLSEASPLKSREYYAYGLPVIVSYDETSMLSRDNACGTVVKSGTLNIGNHEYNVGSSLDEINDFVRSWHGNNKRRLQLHDETMKCMSFKASEIKRIDFFESIIGTEK